jgi:hypothetical protein
LRFSTRNIVEFNDVSQNGNRQRPRGEPGANWLGELVDTERAFV